MKKVLVFSVLFLSASSFDAFAARVKAAAPAVESVGSAPFYRHELLVNSS